MKLNEAVPLIAKHIAENRLADAEKLCRQVLAASPENRDALRWLGHLALVAGQRQEAIDLLLRAARLARDDPGLFCDLGAALAQTGNIDDAIEAHRAALRINRDFFPSISPLAYLLARRDRFDEAIALATRLVELAPRSLKSYFDLAAIQYRAAKPQAAVETLDAALKLDSQNAEVRNTLALNLLCAGDFHRGWELFESRLSEPDVTGLPQFSTPRWDGSPLGEKTLLIHAEQGFGDIIQFARYVPLAAKRGRVVFQCRKALVTLTHSLSSDIAIVPVGEKVNCDLHIPLLSLPGIFDTTLETIPADVPYLAADPQKVASFAEQLRGDGPCIGISWAGNPQHPEDSLRSIDPKSLAPLAELNGIRWVSLQKDRNIPAPTLPMIDLTPQLADFSDTAALMMNLDLIIGVDTSIVHLAGALARPVWTLIATCPDWRWMIAREDSPWYPTMRLFRQTRTGDWESVLARVSDALRDRYNLHQ